LKIILATYNNHKVIEIKKILKMKGVTILSLADFAQKLRTSENGRTFRENALKKAGAAAKKFNMTAVADDSGLCVDALDQGPGVRSARYVRPPVTTKRLCQKLLKAMSSVPDGKRGARFVCAVAIVDPSMRSKVLTGVCQGRIVSGMKGVCGFGYDSVFVPKDHSKTFAQMTTEKKNRLSHRGRAFEQAKKVLRRMIKYGMAQEQ